MNCIYRSYHWGRIIYGRQDHTYLWCFGFRHNYTGKAIISGSLVDWGDELIPLFTLVIRLNTATDIRIERLKRRKYEHFGSRIEIGGDMFEDHQNGSMYDRLYPNTPSVLNADSMTAEEIHTKLQEGYDDLQAGKVQNAASAFKKFRESH